MVWAPGSDHVDEFGAKWLMPAGMPRVKRYESGAWVTHVGAFKARVGGVWVPAVARYWNGTSWVDVM